MAGLAAAGAAAGQGKSNAGEAGADSEVTGTTMAAEHWLAALDATVSRSASALTAAALLSVPRAGAAWGAHPEGAGGPRLDVGEQDAAARAEATVLLVASLVGSAGAASAAAATAAAAVASLGRALSPVVPPPLAGSDETEDGASRPPPAVAADTVAEWCVRTPMQGASAANSLLFTTVAERALRAASEAWTKGDQMGARAALGRPAADVRTRLAEMASGIRAAEELAAMARAAADAHGAAVEAATGGKSRRAAASNGSGAAMRALSSSSVRSCLGVDARGARRRLQGLITDTVFQRDVGDALAGFSGQDQVQDRTGGSNSGSPVDSFEWQQRFRFYCGAPDAEAWAQSVYGGPGPFAPPGFGV